MKNSPNHHSNQGHGITSLTGASPGIFQVLNLVENGEETRHIYSAITQEALHISRARGAALLLPTGKSNLANETVASSGEYTAEKHTPHNTAGPQGGAEQPKPEDNHYFSVISLGAPIGFLVIQKTGQLPEDLCEKLQILAHEAAIVYERQKQLNITQLLLDRLEVLNELNQMIASNAGLHRIVKSLARESAFRFAADLALTFILDEEHTRLEPKGGYGCTPDLLPKHVDLTAGLLGQVMRVGGHLSVPNLKNYAEHGLGFLEKLEIRAVDVCCLEARGEPLGAILNGYRRETGLVSDDVSRFEEFCQGAAVAIANARTQERITAYTERLEELVESRTADLAVQTAKAEEANRAKSRFLANMSHELRTPLTAIVGYSSVLADGIFGDLNEKQRDALGAIVRSSEHLKNLIDDVLNLARIESGKETPEPVRIVLKELLQQIHKLMLQTAVGKGVNLQPLKLPDAVMSTCLWVDAKHIHQIIINLMSNAVKYTPKGGKVWLDAEIISDMVKITVSDTGVGIPAHKLSKLFERFERGDDAYSKNQEGTGIGLNLTRHLVELNGGRIGVDSAEGKGSHFWILMPIAAVESPVVTQHDTTHVKTRLDGLSTLVVDDNKDTAEVLKQILLAVGATVHTAGTVRDGIALLEQHSPDIVLTDLAMPGENGVVLIEHIRNSGGQRAHLPIIVLSACAYDSDKEAAMNAGASIFVPKPFKPAEILHTVRQLTLSYAMRGQE